MWLGDGACANATVTKNSDDLLHIVPRMQAEGIVVSKRKADNVVGLCDILPAMREAGIIGNKHIPPEYFTASRAQRMALLNGLVDTDGYVSDTGLIEVTSVYEPLAYDILRLVRSLGVKASMSIGRAMLNGVDYGAKYRITFFMRGAAPFAAQG